MKYKWLTNILSYNISMNNNLTPSIIIKNKNNVWRNDNLVKDCTFCQKTFTFFVRKHHCRYCGNIFCHECSNKYIVIPNFLLDKPEAEDYWNLSYYVSSLKGNEERVCNECYILINNKIAIRDKIVEIITNPITIFQIGQLSDTNEEIKCHYYDQIRNIQYYLPNHIYSDIDKKILDINSKFFSKHSKYLVNYIKSINWSILTVEETHEKTKHILSILNSEKKYSCESLFCTRTCSIDLSCDDCVNILYSSFIILPNELIKYLMEIILITPERVILCHLQFFVSIIKKNTLNILLTNYIHKLLSTSEKIIYQTFWFLSNEKQIANVNEKANIDKFIRLYNNELIIKMSNLYIFFKGLINSLDNPQIYLINNFNKFKPICLPYDPSIILTEIDYANIQIKESHSKPTIIPFKTETRTIYLLFKRENVMNDILVLNLMTLTDIILHETLQINFGIVIYPIIPLTYNSGMIEIIDNAETVYNISKQHKTILQHIIEKNEQKVVSDILNNYMLSLVSYTLHSYFLGLGDRHLQNIMVTNDGSIFHIDFGFILGKDAYPLSSNNIRLNSGMLDVLGGTDTLRAKKYLELCSQGMIIIRKYFNLFFILLNQHINLDEKYIEKFILSRFQPKQTDDVIVKELLELINQSHNAYSETIRDFLHYHRQEKTVQTSLSNIISSTYNYVRSLKD